MTCSSEIPLLWPGCCALSLGTPPGGGIVVGIVLATKSYSTLLRPHEL